MSELELRIQAECERYGLPYGDPLKSLEALLKHIYDNAELVRSTQRLTIETLFVKRAEAWDEGYEDGASEAERGNDEPKNGWKQNPYAKKEV